MKKRIYFTKILAPHDVKQWSERLFAITTKRTEVTYKTALLTANE